MGYTERNIRSYLCDRCGELVEAEGAEPAPEGWTPLLYGADVATALAAAHEKQKAVEKPIKPYGLCGDCGKWLRLFLGGRKVAD